METLPCFLGNAPGVLDKKFQEVVECFRSLGR
jgi:hypothetical protein